MRLILTASQIYFYKDSRIIEFLRSGCCDCVATVTVQRDELRGTRDENNAFGEVSGSGLEVRDGSASPLPGAAVIGSGESVGKAWGLLPLDERLSFLDQCEDVLHLCYADVAHWDYATLMGYFDAYRLQRVSGGSATDGNTKDGEMPIMFLLVGEGKSYENTLRAMGEYNGIYYTRLTFAN